MEYRSADLRHPPARPHHDAPGAPDVHHGVSPDPEPDRLVGLLVLVLVASSSVVMREPALCDILFPPVFMLTLVTGHLLSPLSLPRMSTGSVIVFMIANLVSVLGARLWGYGDAISYMAVTLYLLVYTAFFALFLGRFGPDGMRIVRT